MADRTVSVALTANITDLERKFERAGVVTKRLESSLEGAGRNVDKLTAATKVAGTQVNDLGDEAATAARKTNNLGSEASEAGRDMLTLAARIEVAKLALHGLSTEFAGSGDSSLTPKIRQARRELAELQRVAKSLVPDKGGKSVFESLGALGSNLRGAMIPALIGGVVAASPIIGAAIGATVAGAVGAGGIIGGIVLAARDVRVKAAWSQMGTDLMTTLSKDSAVFVGPLIDAAGEFELSFLRANSKVQAGFENLSHTVRPLAAGFGGLGEGLAGMFEHVSRVAEPMFREWASQLPSLGNAFDNFGESIEQAGPEIREFWKDFEGGLEHSIVGLGNTVEFLSHTWSSLKEGFILLQDFARLAEGMPAADQGEVVRGLGPLIELQLQANQANELLTKSEKDMADAAKLASDAINKQNQAFHDLLATEMQALNADLNYQQSLLDLTAAVDANGHSLNIHTQKGIDNERAILRVVDALSAVRDKEVAAGAGIEVANGHFQAQIGTLRAHLLQMGFNRDAVDRLVASINKVPPKADTHVNVTGVSPANRAIDSVANKIFQLDGKTATVFVRTVTQTAGAGGFQPMAKGTDYAPGGLAWVGEEGPELAYIPRGSKVYPHQQSMAMAASLPGYAAGVGMSVGATAPINVYGGGLGEAVMAYIRSEVAKQGGTVQAVLGRR